MIVDKLFEAVAKKSLVCVGLDTDLTYIPEYFFKQYDNLSDVLFNFNKKIIDAVQNEVACFKPQIAYYEACGIEGLKAYARTVKYCRDNKNIVIADVKRGDIMRTAQMYAKAHFEGEFEADYVTLSPYLGFDCLDPYLPYVEKNEKGIFVLIRTSNEGIVDLQNIETKDGQTVYSKIGKDLNRIGKKYIGKCGFSSVGGVIGCTHAEEGIELRNNLDSTFFLIPGYGAQGGTAEDVALYLKNGNGGVANSSRGIMLAYKKVADGEKHFDECAYNEVIRMKNEINAAAQKAGK